MDAMISMFIDNELSLKDKIEFVQKVHSERNFKDQTVDLLDQEQLLRSDVVKRVPQVRWRPKERFFFSFFRPRSLAALASSLAFGVVVWFYYLMPAPAVQMPHRFVVYLPSAKQAEITGSFTNWENLPLKKTGGRGYWEITLDLPKGEHRFVYILDGRKRVPDPTVPELERDDFGGENSILLI